MIQAREFVDAAFARGIGFYAGVPCSFLTPFINFVIDDPRLRYVSAANEGDAVAIAAGAAIGGRRSAAMMQNSGLGNAVSPLTSLTWVFRIPLLVVCTHRGAPGVSDEPQHELMGRITGAMFDTIDTPWAPFPSTQDAVAPALQSACARMDAERRPYAFVLGKGTVAPHALRSAGLPARARGCERREFAGTRGRRRDALDRVVRGCEPAGTVVIATTGFTGRELYALADRPNHFYVVGSMGCASALGLGLAMARPDLRVVVVDGDGAALMRMGNFATLGAYGGGNLVHLLLDNEAHESTGAQATVSQGVDFAAIASACGYEAAYSGEDPGLVDALLAAPTGARPRFGHLKIAVGTDEGLPRPAIKPPQVVDRLMAHIGTQF
ncbi:MAG: phosphonopyruvate decarboxylase [Gammaproteobacteria bacterium]